MITPAFSPTATERVLPRLALDFTTGALDPRVTVARSLNTATRVNSSGLIETVNANLPRFDYDPMTLAPKGILIEETRANLLTYSSDFTNPAWVNADTTPTSSAAVAPDGTNTATLLTQGTAGTAEVYQSLAIAAGSILTYTRYVKRGNSDWYMLKIRNGGLTSFSYAWFDLANGTAGTTSSTGGFATIYGSSIRPAGGGWFRVSFTVMIGAAFGVAVYSSLSVSADGNTLPLNSATRYEWGCQAEVGLFPTSYIPTVTSSLTRNADVVGMTGANFSSWYNQTEGAFFVNASFISLLANFPMLVSASNSGNPAAYISSNKQGSGGVSVYSEVSDTTPQAVLTNLTSISVYMPFNTTLAYRQNSFAASGNGISVATDASGTVPALDKLDIGNRNGGLFLNGWISKLLYWPQRITDAEVQAFSK